MDLLNEVALSGTSVGLANICTSPLDMIKVRMQLSKTKQGIFKTGHGIIKEEGILNLWRGIGPTVARGFFFGGTRLGLYTPIKMIISKDKPPNFYQKIVAGSLSGGFAAALTSPIELIKTRLQSNVSSDSRNSLDVIRKIINTDGVKGLWKGAVPGLIRASLLTASQCAVYDESKNIIKKHTGINEGIKLHIISSMISGLVTTTVTSPLDVVKTNMYVGGKNYSNMTQCVINVYRRNGIYGFFGGWSASYIRLGPHTLIMFVSAEYLRKINGFVSL